VVPRPSVPGTVKHVQTEGGLAVAAPASPVNDVVSLLETSLPPTVRQYIHDLIDGRTFFDPYGADAMWMRALFARAEQTDLPALEWSGQPIAILVMDFAHDRACNEAMWRVFSPSFQNDRTTVVFNQFGNIPAGEVCEFCRDRALELVPLHKPNSSAKSFRYRKCVV
jgi:hypothetical protein